MQWSLDETIVAQASAHGPAARGILRISGASIVRVLNRAFRDSAGQPVTCSLSRAAWISAEVDLQAGQTLPGQLLIWPDHRSYTRQPSAEFHTLGAPAGLQLALRSLCQEGARLAMPGEFTLRAFLAGRIDLTQAEAILGLIDARSQQEFNLALAQSAGGLATPFQQLRDELLDLLADLEATLDFVDQDISFLSPTQLESRLSSIRATAIELNERIQRQGALAGSHKALLVGRPNVGKSSLFNALLQTERAIVSPVSGTTRDTITARLDLDGPSLELLDSAGITTDPRTHESSLPNENWVDEFQLPPQVQAIRRTERETAGANLVLWCVEASELAARQFGFDLPRGWIGVATKCDQLDASVELGPSWVLTSARLGFGIERLAEVIRQHLGARERERGDVLPATATRCAQSAQEIVASLTRAMDACLAKSGEEIVAAEIRGALDCLGQIVGSVYNDDVLARVFSRFCIGK